MLRVGLTGGLGSGKSTAAAMLGALGARVIASDEIGRAMMQPGERVYEAIVREFGPGVLLADGQLDRAGLARLAFAEGRLEALTAIVHPAVIARETAIAAEVARDAPRAVLVVESALLFETEYAGEGGWRRRFDRIVLITAPDATKVSRFVARAGGDAAMSEMERAAEARRRLARQIDDATKAQWADFVVENDGAVGALRVAMEQLWPRLQAEAIARADDAEAG